MTTHVLPNDSGAGTAREALSELGRSDRVLGCPDDLSFGPITDLSGCARCAFLERYLDDAHIPPESFDWASEIDAFWTSIEALTGRVIIWLARTDASNYCMAAEVVERLNESAEPRIIDPTGQRQAGATTDRPPARIFMLGGMLPKHFVPLIGSDKPLGPDVRSSWKRDWNRLRSENAVLRTWRSDGVVSVSDDYFDGELLSYASQEWQPAARFVGELIGRWIGSGRVPPDAMPLMWRIRELVHQGKLVAETEFEGKWKFNVRLPA